MTLQVIFFKPSFLDSFMMIIWLWTHWDMLRDARNLFLFDFQMSFLDVQNKAYLIYSVGSRWTCELGQMAYKHGFY